MLQAYVDVDLLSAVHCADDREGGSSATGIGYRMAGGSAWFGVDGFSFLVWR
jgi:hypothetical protein